MKHYRLILLIMVCMLIPAGICAEETEEENYTLGIGLSTIAPGLPVAVKVVQQNGMWGWQAEFNYFYILGMARLDGRKVLKGDEKTHVYAFAGLTLSHFNHYDETPSYLEFILSADFGIGANWRFAKRLSLGVEGGLLVPFLCNTGMDQFDNSGLMVANVHLLYWL